MGDNSAGVAKAAFYKDREGVVHLQGHVISGARLVPMFQLPAGYRPASGISLEFSVVCSCAAPDTGGDTASVDAGELVIEGPGNGFGNDGAVILESQTDGLASVSLDGVTFRAEQ